MASAAKYEAGNESSSDSDFATHYLLNMGKGRFCFSLPEDLTVKDYFCIFIIVPCLYFCRKIQDATARSCPYARHETFLVSAIRNARQ